MALLTEPVGAISMFFCWQRIHQIHSELSSPISFRVPGAITYVLPRGDASEIREAWVFVKAYDQNSQEISLQLSIGCIRNRLELSESTVGFGSTIQHAILASEGLVRGSLLKM